MQQAAVATEQNLTVRVSGWSNSRHVVVREDEVSMEIARTHCQHCPTCRARVVHCERSLSGRQFKRQSAGGGEYFVLPLPVGLASDSERVVAFLAGALNLSICKVAG